jgi:hypothetical protein
MAQQIDEYFTTTVTAMANHTGPGKPDRDEPIEAESSLSVQQVLELFDAQLGSRHLDLAARWLRSKGKGFYTIGSSGHEGNAVVARALRPTDPHCCTTARGASSSNAPGRCRALTRYATCCSGSSPPPTNRSRAGGTRCSAAAT